MLKNPVITWKLGHRLNYVGHFSPDLLLSLIEDCDACVAWSASGVDGRN
jgi:hypothetical protein